MLPSVKNAAVERAIRALQAGRPILLSDDMDRENEGDFVVAAEWMTPELVVLMCRESSGIISVPMLQERLGELQLPTLPQAPLTDRATAFTLSVDAATGVTTGSSAHDRARTIQLLASPSATSSDFTRPGHINPICARRGLLADRAGHTEASLELMLRAKLQPVSVISEIMGADGQMLRVPELYKLSERLGLEFISIEMLR